MRDSANFWAASFTCPSCLSCIWRGLLFYSSTALVATFEPSYPLRGTTTLPPRAVSRPHGIRYRLRTYCLARSFRTALKGLSEALLDTLRANRVTILVPALHGPHHIVLVDLFR